MKLDWPSFSPSKDVTEHPMLHTGTARLAWLILTQRLTAAGRWFAIPTLIFGTYGGISLQIQGYIVFSYFFAFWAIAAAAMLALRPKVRLKALMAPRICAGQTLPIDVEIEQLGRLSQIDLVVLPHRLPQAVDADPDGGAAVPSLRKGQRTRVRLGLKCNKRGVYKLRGFRVECDYPFGLLRASRTFDDTRALTVYPRFQPVGHITLPTGRRHHPGGVTMASNLGESFEFVGDREFRDGDSTHDIDWRATARLSRPIVREYREEYFMRVAVILDTYVQPKSTALEHDNFERAVSVAAGASDYLARQDYLVDIFAAGPNVYHLAAGRSLAYLDQILDILACVGENENEPFAVVEPQLMENLAQITTVICVLLDWNEPRRDFVRKIVSSGSAAKVIIVRDSPCTIDPSIDGNLLGRASIVSRQQYEMGLERL